MKILKRFLHFAFLCGLAQSASASLVNIHLAGHVLDYIPGNPTVGLDTYGVFGSPGNRINGDAYTAIITYDTALAPPSAASNYGSYARDCDPCTTSVNGFPFLSIAVTINGHTETVSGADHLETAIISASSTQDTISFQTANHTSPPITNGLPFDESSADFTFNSINGQFLTNSFALPTSLNLSALFNPGVSTKIGDLSILRGTYGNPNIISAQVSAYLSLDKITSVDALITTVPIPAAGWFLGVGIMSLARFAKRHSINIS